MILRFKGLRLRLLKHFAVTIFSANQLDYFFLFQPQKIVVYLHRKKRTHDKGKTFTLMAISFLPFFKSEITVWNLCVNLWWLARWTWFIPLQTIQHGRRQVGDTVVQEFICSSLTAIWISFLWFQICWCMSFSFSHVFETEKI